MTAGTPREIVYPTRWEYRVFVSADALETARTAVGYLLAEQDEHAELVDGEKSSSGKYLALRARAEVKNKAEAEALGRKLAQVPGVKFVL